MEADRDKEPTDPDAVADIAQWMPPSMGQASNHRARKAAAVPHSPTAAEIEALQKAAYEEGYEQGRQEGQRYGHQEALEEGRKAIAAKLATLEQLMHSLQRPFERLDDEVEQQIVTLVINMVRQLVRREIKTDPGQIIGVVREALAALPVSARSIRVILHPEDAVLVREVYSLGESEQQWTIVEDPTVQRGGCRVTTENSQVDATLESRLGALIAPLLAAERTQDTDEEDAP
jgi:flagellar assembly protein FliH